MVAATQSQPPTWYRPASGAPRSLSRSPDRELQGKVCSPRQPARRPASHLPPPQANYLHTTKRLGARTHHMIMNEHAHHHYHFVGLFRFASSQRLSPSSSRRRPASKRVCLAPNSIIRLGRRPNLQWLVKTLKQTANLKAKPSAGAQVLLCYASLSKKSMQMDAAGPMVALFERKTARAPWGISSAGSAHDPRAHMLNARLSGGSRATNLWPRPAGVAKSKGARAGAPDARKLSARRALGPVWPASQPASQSATTSS